MKKKKEKKKKKKKDAAEAGAGAGALLLTERAERRGYEGESSVAEIFLWY